MEERVEKVNVSKIISMKGKEKIVMLTAYDYSMAHLLDGAGVEIVFVGDSLGVCFLGQKDTLSVTVEQIIYHAKAVKAGLRRALLVADMPFMSYQTGCSEAVYNAGRIVKEAGVEAVKIEGGKEFEDVVSSITKCGIPVMGHIGFTPQFIHKWGGYRVVGRDEESAQKLLEDAEALQRAGAFCIVLECVPWRISKKLTETLKIPTIGCGAGPYCDGQVLVINDILSLPTGLGKVPKFVRRYASIAEEITNAVKRFIDDVKKGDYPKLEESFQE